MGCGHRVSRRGRAEALPTVRARGLCSLSLGLVSFVSFSGSGDPQWRTDHRFSLSAGCPIGIRPLSKPQSSIRPSTPLPLPPLLATLVGYLTMAVLHTHGSAFYLGLQPDLCSGLQGAPLPSSPCAFPLEAVNIPRLSRAKPGSSRASTPLGTLPFTPAASTPQSPSPEPGKLWHTEAGPAAQHPHVSLCPGPASSRCRLSAVEDSSPHPTSGCRVCWGFLSRVLSLSGSPWTARCRTFKLTPCFLEFLVTPLPTSRQILQRRSSVSSPCPFPAGFVLTARYALDFEASCLRF